MLLLGESEFNGQSRQFCAESGLYLPASQCAQVPPFTPPHPALHLQSLFELLDAGELEFGGHVWHTELCAAAAVTEYFPLSHAVQTPLPRLILYVPVSQTTHDDAPDPVYPELHEHC